MKKIKDVDYFKNSKSDEILWIGFEFLDKKFLVGINFLSLNKVEVQCEVLHPGKKQWELVSDVKHSSDDAIMINANMEQGSLLIKIQGDKAVVLGYSQGSYRVKSLEFITTDRNYHNVYDASNNLLLC